MRLGTFAASAALLCLVSAAAMAADVPASRTVTRIATPPSLAYSLPQWAGFYVGAAASYQEFDGSAQILLGGVQVGRASDDSTGGSGALFGGYLWQSGRLVFGPEVQVGFGKHESVSWDARARLGWAVDRVLVYATAGVTSAKLREEVDGFGDQRLGWVAGGGLEVKLTEHWNGRIELTHREFGEKDHIVAPFTVRSTFSSNQATAGISYRF